MPIARHWSIGPLGLSSFPATMFRRYFRRTGMRKLAAGYSPQRRASSPLACVAVVLGRRRCAVKFAAEPGPTARRHPLGAKMDRHRRLRLPRAGGGGTSAAATCPSCRRRAWAASRAVRRACFRSSISARISATSDSAASARVSALASSSRSVATALSIASISPGCVAGNPAPSPPRALRRPYGSSGRG